MIGQLREELGGVIEKNRNIMEEVGDVTLSMCPKKWMTSLLASVRVSSLAACQLLFFGQLLITIPSYRLAIFIYTFFAFIKGHYTVFQSIY